MAYQSFGADDGVSKSRDKLASIKLPADLTGKSLLDLGCNEGFFSIEAKRRGAARVVGFDRDERFVTAARQRAAQEGLDVEFTCRSMTDLPSERFDYILLLSALHYISEPGPLLARIRNVLNPGGTLILEIGVARNCAGMTVGRALRSVDERFFATPDLLTRVWLRDYAVREVGRSVAQLGDPLPRFVYHCTPARTNVLFIVGEGGIGKTHLSTQMAGVPIVSTDQLLMPTRALGCRVTAEQQAYDKLMAEAGDIALTWSKLRHDPKARAYFADVIAEAVRHCAGAGQVVVEGFTATDLVDEVKARLGPGYYCWRATTG